MYWLLHSIMQAFAWLGGWLWSRVLQLGYWVWVHVWEQVENVFVWVLGKLPAGWSDYLHQNPFGAELWALADRVEDFIPWKECVGIWIFTFGILMVIRLVRWVVGIEIVGISLRG